MRTERTSGDVELHQQREDKRKRGSERCQRHVGQQTTVCVKQASQQQGEAIVVTHVRETTRDMESTSDSSPPVEVSACTFLMWLSAL